MRKDTQDRAEKHCFASVVCLALVSRSFNIQMVSAEASELNELLPSLQQNASLQGEVEACIKSHGLSPQEFFYKWEAFALAMGGDVVLDQNTFSMLRRELQDALERSTRREANKTIPANKSMASPTVKVDNLDAVYE